VIIATEDTKATVAYFQAFISPDYYQSPHVHVEVLTRTSGGSAPENVLRQLDEWRNEYQFGEGDEFWLVVDVDQWGDGKLSSVVQECIQKSISLAVSNPAIEIWFLLHLTDLTVYRQTDLDEFLANEKVNNKRTRLDQEIVQLIGRYNKANLHVEDFLPNLEDAIRRAEALDHAPTDRWPQGLGTRVYRLARSIINRGR
jgi:hypothetical protein